MDKVASKLLPFFAAFVLFGFGTVVGHKVGTAWPKEFKAKLTMECLNSGLDMDVCACAAKSITETFTPQEFVLGPPEAPLLVARCIAKFRVTPPQTAEQ